MLPVFFRLHLEGILQPVQQLVGELADILLLREAHSLKKDQLWVTEPNYTTISKRIQSVKSMPRLSSARVHWALDARWLLLSSWVHRLVNFKGDLCAPRPCSHRHQCCLVIQVNASPTWLIHRGLTWLMNTEARSLTSVNLCTDWLRATAYVRKKNRGVLYVWHVYVTL